MKKILTINEAVELAQRLRKQNKTIVLAGGFFDILHLGHIKFLEKSKKYGDYLFVLLEEDRKAKIEKGMLRPINSQKDRAKILESIQSVDYIILLKNMTNNNLYDKIVTEMRPTIIATTDPDPYVAHKIRQAKLIHSKVVYAIKRIDNYSTTKEIQSINAVS